MGGCGIGRTSMSPPKRIQWVVRTTGREPTEKANRRVHMTGDTHCPFCHKPFTSEEIEENRNAEEQFLAEVARNEVADIEHAPAQEIKKNRQREEFFVRLTEGEAVGNAPWDDGLLEEIYRQPHRAAE